MAGDIFDLDEWRVDPDADVVLSELQSAGVAVEWDESTIHLTFPNGDLRVVPLESRTRIPRRHAMQWAKKAGISPHRIFGSAAATG